MQLARSLCNWLCNLRLLLYLGKGTRQERSFWKMNSKSTWSVGWHWRRPWVILTTHNHLGLSLEMMILKTSNSVRSWLRQVPAVDEAWSEPRTCNKQNVVAEAGFALGTTLFEFVTQTEHVDLVRHSLIANFLKMWFLIHNCASVENHCCSRW